MDIILQILQAIGNLLTLVVLALLWRRAFRPSEFRNFWRLLAAAWTMNLLGNIAWILHDLITGTTLDAFSFVDLFYVSRYLLIGLALWLYPVPLSRRAWFWIGGTMLAVIVIVWLLYSSPALTIGSGDWIFFLGLAMYPVLDAGSIALAWLRFRTARESAWSRYALLLFYAVTSYGIANTLNLTEYALVPISGGILPNVFWILTDIVLLVMVSRADPRAENQSWARVQE